MRLCACLNAELHVIEPCGFPLDDAKLKRVGMDYRSHVVLVRHADWDAFCAYRNAHEGRLLIIETDGSTPYTQHSFAPSDYVMLGRESAGTPHELYAHADATLHIPMREGLRSLNMAMCAGIVVAEACRQLG